MFDPTYTPTAPSGINTMAARLAFELNGDMALVARLLKGEPDAITLAATLRWSKAEDEILEVFGIFTNILPNVLRRICQFMLISSTSTSTSPSAEVRNRRRTATLHARVAVAKQIYGCASRAPCLPPKRCHTLIDYDCPGLLWGCLKHNC